MLEAINRKLEEEKRRLGEVEMQEDKDEDDENESTDNDTDGDVQDEKRKETCIKDDIWRGLRLHGSGASSGVQLGQV